MQEQASIRSALILSAFLLASCAGPQMQRVDGSQTPEAREPSHPTDADTQNELKTQRDDSERTRANRSELPTEASPSVDISAAAAVARNTTNAALDRATEHVVGWRTAPEDLHYLEILDDSRELEGSVSLGTTGRGELQGAVELAIDGEHHSVIERHRRRSTQWATQEMVDLIEHAASRVDDAFPGSTLRLGNISRSGGGDIPWSSSHNSGRDADLAFFCEDRVSGDPVLAPDLLHFNDDGVATNHPDIAFDVERNWVLVKALLNHPDVEIQWIFVSEALKQMLIEHAQGLGEDEQLIMQAGHVLHQPTDAPPHADHFHLRITCAPKDRVEGCLDFGPRWEWVDWNYDAVLGRTLALREALREADAETKLDALDFMEKIRSRYAPEVALLAALNEPNEQVRLRALEVASGIPYWSATAVVAAREYIDSDHPTHEKAFAYAVMRRSLDPMVPGVVRQVLADKDRPASERALAARALAHAMQPDLIPFILEQLSVQPAQVRAELAMVLRRIANHSQLIDWQNSSASERATALTAWEKWWTSHRKESRDAWLIAGFESYGFDHDRLLRLAAVDDIIPLLQSAPDHAAYNANQTLRRITGRWSPLEAWSHERLHDYWSGWWSKNRERMLANK